MTRLQLVLVTCALAFAVAPAALTGLGGVAVLLRPSFPGPAAAPARGDFELAVVSSQPNEITDVARWIERNRVDLRQYRIPGSLDGGRGTTPPAFVPRKLYGFRLVKAIRQPRTILAIYGKDFASGRLLVAYGLDGGRRYAVDFGTYAYAPVTAPGEREFVYQQVVWAVEAGGVLYVQTSHSTYSRSSGRLNAYLTAIHLDDFTVRWRSPALVANAERFELYGGTIVSGYGFTAEPDYLWLLDRRTGRPLAQAALPSAPELIVRKGSRLYVRTYDHDVVAKLVRS